jgi:hypothetical protein
MFSESAQWRDPYKEKGIVYDESDNDGGDDDDSDESHKDKDDNLLTPLRKHIDLKRLADKNILNKLHEISFNYLAESYINQRKKIKNIEKIDIDVLRYRINKINYISPFWEIILVPILSKSIGLNLKYLLKQSPKKVAVISFYLGHQLKSLFNQTFYSFLDLSVYYPKSKVPESTKYRLKNISHFINSTLKYSMHDIHINWGSRIRLVRLIEDFIGKMKTKTANYSNILTGKHMGRIDFDQIEEKTIDYLDMYFLKNLKYEARELEKIISKDINFTITQGN